MVKGFNTKDWFNSWKPRIVSWNVLSSGMIKGQLI